MPYVKSQQREKYDPWLEPFYGKIESKGDLEYCIFSLLKAYMRGREYNYSNLHDAVYATIHAGEEFRRRYLDKREDESLSKNGDIE